MTITIDRQENLLSFYSFVIDFSIKAILFRKALNYWRQE